jgi:hypothetical protein
VERANAPATENVRQIGAPLVKQSEERFSKEFKNVE